MRETPATQTNTNNKPQKALDRFLEGWTVREVLTEKGAIRYERIYIGDYYTSRETKSARVLRKLLYVLLFAAAVALLVLSAVQPVGANLTGYVAISQGVVILAAIWVLHSLFGYVTSPAEMTVGDYKGGTLALRRSSFFMALSYLLPMVMTLVHLLTDPSQAGKELLCVLGYAVGGAIVLLLHLVEKKLAYDKRPSPEKSWSEGRKGEDA